MSNIATRTARHRPQLSLPLTGAVLAIATSAAINVTYAMSMGAAHSTLHATIFAAGALAATLLAASLPAVFVQAFKRGEADVAATSFVLWLAAIAFSVLAAIGAASTARSNFSSSRQADAAAHSRLSAEHQRIVTDLASIPAGRSSAELVPLIASKTAATKGANCADWTASTSIRAACIDLGKLRAEAARSVHRQQLASNLAAITEQLNNAQSPKAADPQAAALAAYSAALGYNVTADQIGQFLSLSVAIFFELASALGLLAAGYGSPSSTHVTAAVPAIKPLTGDQPGSCCTGFIAKPTSLSAPSATVAEPVNDAVQFPASNVHRLPARKPTANSSPAPSKPAAVDLQARIRNEIEASGGNLVVTQRKLARLVDSNPAAINRSIATMVAAGTVIAVAGHSATELRLVL
jgi:hypothetical protein